MNNYDERHQEFEGDDRVAELNQETVEYEIADVDELPFEAEYPELHDTIYEIEQLCNVQRNSMIASVP